MRCSLLVVVAATGLSACGSDLIFEPHKVDHQSKAGEVHVAAIAIAPWEEYIARLSPEFELKAKDAVNEVIPQTATFEKQILRTTAVDAKLGLPTVRTETVEKDSLAADGTSSSTKDSTQTRKSGELPGDEVAATAPDPKLTRTITPPDATALGIDPMLKYTAATALYQEVKLLERYVQDAAGRHNMVPYVLRVQLTLSPYARHQPYDYHIIMSFFAQSSADGDVKKITRRSSCR